MRYTWIHAINEPRNFSNNNRVLLKSRATNFLFIFNR
ncbi:hypothetical protein BMETH_1438_0 [methanotrophic bacterial endosymbiont of Bathymodiolus sp.]|nr:hypothetical protein BMETH_1438_0 [methanotrophic bacterial endosymbiont of Bathymodiolus sp.]